MAVGGGGVEALFWRGPITPGDVASWLAPGVLEDGGTGGGGGGSTFPNYIFLSGNTILANASVGDVIGTLSVINTTGYTFSIVYDPSGLFQISGGSLEVGASVTGNAGMNPVVIQATNGVTTITYGYVIFVIPVHVGFVPTYYIYGF